MLEDVDLDIDEPVIDLVELELEIELNNDEELVVEKEDPLELVVL